MEKLMGIVFSPLCLLMLSFLISLRHLKNKPLPLYFCLVVLYLLCIEPVKQIVVYPLESYAHFIEKSAHYKQVDAKAIVVLGGGVSYHGNWGGSRLSLDALARIFKAKQIYDELDGSVPIISSAGLPQAERGIPAESIVMASTFEYLNVMAPLIERSSKNTHENALLTRQMLQSSGLWVESYPVILVSSAMHLPRAVACFEGQGFSVIPQASHYVGSPELYLNFRSFLPLPFNLTQISQAIHEYLGIVYYKLLSRI